MSLSMFKESDQSKAKSLLDRYEYHMHFAIKFVLEGDFTAASKHHEEMADVLKQLGILRDYKRAVDNATQFYKEVSKRAKWEDVVNGIKGIL